MYFLLLLFCGIVFCAQVPLDVADCFDSKQCKISSVGAFYITGPINGTITEGHIYEITNGLTYDAYFYWDTVIGMDINNGNNVNTSLNNAKHQILVPSGNVRYFDSGIFKNHITRLFIRFTDNSGNSVFESMDKAKIAKAEKRDCKEMFLLN